MPVGVQVTTTPSAATSGAPTGDIRTYFVAGQCHRGDTTAPVILTSFAQVQDLLGSRVTYGTLYDDLQTFFGELAGTPGRAIVARVVGPSASKGTLTLADASAVATLRIDAKDEGAWSSSISVQVLAAAVTGTFTLQVSYKGVLLETYPNLATPAAAAAALNSSGLVRGTDLGSATTAPNNNPAVLAATALSAGSGDTTNVTSSALVTALSRFSPDLGPGAVAIPGQPHTAVAAGLLAHAAATNRIALTAPAAGTSVAAASTAARGLRASVGSERLGFFYPWIQIPDGGGGVRTISPEGFVAGRRGATIDAAGAASASRAPAGQAGSAHFAIGLEKTLTTAEVNSLSDDAVNPIKLGTDGPKLYDWRSLSLDEVNYRFLTTADLLDDISYRAGVALDRFLFRSIDGRGRFLTQVATELEAILAPIADAGGLYAQPDGNPPDPGYRVDVGAAVNTTVTLARGEVRAIVEVRDSPLAELIRVTLSKVALTNDF